MGTHGCICSYSKKLCCPVFIGKSTGHIFTGAAAHLRVWGWHVHLVLKKMKQMQEWRTSRTMTMSICQNVLNVLDAYWSTFLGAVDRGDFHGVETSVWISLMQTVDSVTQVSLKVLNQRLAWSQHCYPLEKTHLCLLYTHTETQTGWVTILFSRWIWRCREAWKLKQWTNNGYSMSVVTIVTGMYFHAWIIRTAYMLRTATVGATVWNLDQHLPLRENSADLAEFAHFFLLLAKTWLDSDLWFSFLLTYHLTDGERAVLTLAFWEWQRQS